jgi:hypothetical protein
MPAPWPIDPDYGGREMGDLLLANWRLQSGELWALALEHVPGYRGPSYECLATKRVRAPVSVSIPLYAHGCYTVLVATRDPKNLDAHIVLRDGTNRYQTHEKSSCGRIVLGAFKRCIRPIYGGDAVLTLGSEPNAAIRYEIWQTTKLSDVIR